MRYFILCGVILIIKGITMVKKENLIKYIEELKRNLKKLDILRDTYQDSSYIIYLRRLEKQINDFNKNNQNIRIKMNVGELNNSSLIIFVDNKKIDSEETLLKYNLEDREYDLILETDLIVPCSNYNLFGRQSRGFVHGQY
ncbi:hypothetical protein HOD20_00705 [archaeon]|jgi:hypothetical protein|nr:hypothetical protein [archaeon]MBT4351022.1 hypothetical protein [archaeon]MBT4647838.1 hypothetical protein [archaeon]MBT6821039.1 hypothetical protein [archaeon]MBT7392042.1 hypothetical protein [archaeon]